MTVNVSLISPPSRRTDHYRPPLALMYLAAFLEKNDVSTEIIDIKLNWESCLEPSDDTVRLIMEVSLAAGKKPQKTRLSAYGARLVQGVQKAAHTGRGEMMGEIGSSIERI